MKTRLVLLVLTFAILCSAQTRNDLFSEITVHGIQSTPVNVDKYRSNCTTTAECGVNLVCNERGICSDCTADDQCGNYPAYLCYNDQQISTETQNGTVVQILNVCEQKSLFPPNIYEILASIICFIGGMMCASSGIGGGGIYVSMLILLGNFTPQVAVPLSTVIIFGSSISNFALLAFQKHPNNPSRPIIDYDVSLVTQPIILAGTILGVLFNIMFPNYLIIILLIALLAVTTARTVKNTIKTWRAEKKAQEQKLELEKEESERNEPRLRLKEGDDEVEELEQQVQEEDEEMKDIDISSPVVSNANESESPVDELDTNITAIEDKIALETIIKKESSRFPKWTLMLLGVAWLIVFIVALLKGGKAAPSFVGIKTCSPAYWIVTGLAFPILFGFSFAVGLYMHSIHKKKLRLNYQFTEGDIKWTLRNSLLIPTIFLTAGIVAGLLGIGGGMITGPLMLELGMVPQVVTSTSSFMIFFTASSTLVQYVLVGAIQWDYGLWFLVLGIACGALGQYGVGVIIKKYKKQSWIVMLVTASIMISGLMMGGVGIYQIVLDIQKGAYLGFKDPCASL